MVPKRQYVVVQKGRNKHEFRSGHGYSLNELKELGLNAKEARDLGIRVDLRRKSMYEKNIEYLMGQYNLTRQKVKPKPPTKPKKEEVTQPAPKKKTATKPKKKTTTKKTVVEKAPVEKTTPKKSTVKKTTVTETAVKNTAAPKKKTTSPKKAPTTEEFHKMYHGETGKNAIWRGKESGVYLKWLSQKKKDLGL